MGSVGRQDKIREGLHALLTAWALFCGQWGGRLLTREGQEQKCVLKGKP